MVSWLIYIGHLIVPFQNGFSLRWPFCLLGLFVMYIWLCILREKKLTERQIFLFLIFLTLNPLLGIGSIMATPDMPLVFFWSLSYLFYTRLFESKKLINYAGLGLSLGLGFCSKYHIVLFVLSGIISIILTKKWRQLRKSGILLTLLLGFVFSLPVLIWNSQNEWSSFLFQINHGFGESGFEWNWPLNYILTQFLLVNPVIFYYLTREAISKTDSAFTWSQFIFFLTSSFKSIVEGNWPITGHLHALAVATVKMSQRTLQSALLYWLLIYAVLFGFLLSEKSEKVRLNLVNESQLSEIYPLIDQYKPLYGPSYQVASLISWKTGVFIPKLSSLSRIDFFDSLSASTPQNKEFYVLKYNNSAWPDKYVRYNKNKIRSFDKLNLGLYHFIYE